MSNYRWNDWADGVTVVLQAIVYIPMFYIILMPCFVWRWSSLEELRSSQVFFKRWPRQGGWLLLGL